MQMQHLDGAVMEVRCLTKWFHVGGGGPFGWGGPARYVHAVDDVSFTLRKRRILALVGESGSGKSTIARLLARLYPPTSGKVLLKGQRRGLGAPASSRPPLPARCWWSRASAATTPVVLA